MASVTGERVAAKHKHKRKHKQKLKFKVGVVGVVARRGVCMLVRSMDGESEERLAQKKRGYLQHLELLPITGSHDKYWWYEWTSTYKSCVLTDSLQYLKECVASSECAHVSIKQQR